VGVGALCPAFIVSGGVGCSVVRVVVSGLRCGALLGVSRVFCAWVYIYMGLPFPGLVAAFPGLMGTPPGGGLTRGETGQGSTPNILKK